MPKNNLNILINFFIFLFLVSLCVGAQTIVWPALNLPQPQLWILPFVFVILYRNFWYSLLFAYGTTFVLTGFTTLPMGLLLAIIIMLFVFIQFIKQRFFWPEFSFFLLVSFISGFLFPALHFFLSFSNDAPAIVKPEFAQWFIQPLLMIVMSYPLFYICQKLDRMTRLSEAYGMGAD